MVTLTQSCEWRQQRFTEWYDGKGAGKPGKDCYTQLAKYEDLGLTPEELREVLRDSEALLIKKICEVHAKVRLETDGENVVISNIDTPDLNKEIKLIRGVDESNKDILFYERLRDLGEKRRTVYESIESGPIFEKLKEDILEARKADYTKQPDIILVWEVLVGTNFKGTDFRYVCLEEKHRSTLEEEISQIDEEEERE